MLKHCMVLYKPCLLREVEILLLGQGGSKLQRQVHRLPLIGALTAQQWLEDRILILLLRYGTCRGMSTGKPAVICRGCAANEQRGKCQYKGTPEVQSVIIPPQMSSSSSFSASEVFRCDSPGSFSFLTLKTCFAWTGAFHSGPC